MSILLQFGEIYFVGVYLSEALFSRENGFLLAHRLLVHSFKTDNSRDRRCQNPSVEDRLTLLFDCGDFPDYLSPSLVSEA